MEKKLKEILQKQKDFQRLVGFPVDSLLEQERNEASEKYLFKLIEEVIELRREFPSAMNPWSKHQKQPDMNRIYEELSDVLLFLINFINLWKLDTDELINKIEEVQHNNFASVKLKKMNLLNQEILGIPGHSCKIGVGNINPKTIIVTTTYNFDPSCSHFDAYYTSLVKDADPTTLLNTELMNFWRPFLIKELDIIKSGTDAIIQYADPVLEELMQNK